MQRGDRDALDALVRRYLRAIHAVAASYVAERADVDDAVQETFLRAIDRIAGYDAARPFAPWLYQVARNVARDRAAKHARRPTEPLADGALAEPAPGPDIMTERAEIRRAVDAAIAALPEQRRTAFRMHDVDGYSTDDIARIMGLAAGTIRSHVHHARRALRTALSPLMGESRAPPATEVGEGMESGEVGSPPSVVSPTVAREQTQHGDAGTRSKNAGG